MRLWVRFVGVAVCASSLLVSTPRSWAQQEQSESHRKMATKVVPIYPSLAQKMGIAGSVKIEALVAPNGTVKSAGILGGHPVLAQAGVDAVRRCKWEPAARDTKEVVIFNFHPE
jgi:TonB family protein